MRKLIPCLLLTSLINEIDGARLTKSELISQDDRGDDGRGLLGFFDPSQDTRRQDDGVDEDVADAITDCLNDLIGCILNPIAENPGSPALLAAISATTFVGGIAGAAKLSKDDMKEKDKKDKYKKDKYKYEHDEYYYYDDHDHYDHDSLLGSSL